MFGRRKASAKRFSLLLLEEEEDYVQDWVARCRWPQGVSGNWQAMPELPGRFRLCTRSLFFEPDDTRVPIARLPFQDVQALEQGGAPGASSFSCVSSSVTKMRANMEEVPYAFDKGKINVWVFTLMYAPLHSCLPVAQKLLAINHVPHRLQRGRELEAFVREHEEASGFDTSRLLDFSERILLEVPAAQLSPLVREHGHLVVTDSRIYFQPLHNVSGDTPVRSHPLFAVAAVARRRSSLRQIGLELFFVGPETFQKSTTAASSSQVGGPVEGAAGFAALPLSSPGHVWDAPSAFFAFRSEHEREAAAHALLTCPHLGSVVAAATHIHGCNSASSQVKEAGASMVAAHGRMLEAQGGWLPRVTAAWQSGRVSNFDYLLYLNLAAGRSFNDLAQWPVFPWILSDYISSTLDLNNPASFRDLSKPVGALNPARLQEFKRRFRDMPADSLGKEGGIRPFMYGTHYSTPGYVMFWLLRAAPAHMLHLQNGRFDAPDRLFASIRESWQSVNTSSTDVKELIPEFFLPGGDWLVNALRLPLGVRQSGVAVDDVELPPWAESPEDFLAKHRHALESPWVSRHLHNWIDLIFGFKQTGRAAEEADNVFFHLTYEGAVDVSKVSDPIELRALECQINEFGQTPAQLFRHPHPARLVYPAPLSVDPSHSSVFAEGTNSSTDRYSALALALISTVEAASLVEPTELRTARDDARAVCEELGLQQQRHGVASTSARAEQQQGGLSASTPTSSGAGAGAGVAASTPGPLIATESTPLLPQPHHVCEQAAAEDSVQDDSRRGSKASSEGGRCGMSSGGATLSQAGGVACAASMLASAGSSMFGGLLKLGRYNRPLAQGGQQQGEQALDRQHQSLQRPQQQQPQGSATSQEEQQRASTPQSKEVQPPLRCQQQQQQQQQGPAMTHNTPQPLPHSAPAEGGVLHPQVPPSNAANAANTQPFTPEHHHTQHQWGPNFPERLLCCSTSSQQCHPEQQARTASVCFQDRAQEALAAVVLWRPPCSDQGALDGSLTPSAAQAALSNLPTSPSAAAAAAAAAAAGSPSTGAVLYAYTAGLKGTLRVLQLQQTPVHALPHNVPTPRGTSMEPFRASLDSEVSLPSESQGTVQASVHVLRTADLGSPILCLAALHPPPSHQQLVGRQQHPLLLAGTHYKQVHAYSVESAYVVGTWDAHNDGVSCMAITEKDGTGSGSKGLAQLVTASWDGSIKVWDVREGQEPWAQPGLAPLPLLELDVFDAGVWAMCLAHAPNRTPDVCSAAAQHEAATQQHPPQQQGLEARACMPTAPHVAVSTRVGAATHVAGRPQAAEQHEQAPPQLPTGVAQTTLLLAGSEEGEVALWDLTAPQSPLWRCCVAQDYVGAAALTPCGLYAVIGAADGGLTLLHTKSGATAAKAYLDSPIRSCSTDGRFALVGCESGAARVWDLDCAKRSYPYPQLTALIKPSHMLQPSLDGLFIPWHLRTSAKTVHTASCPGPVPGASAALPMSDNSPDEASHNAAPHLHSSSTSTSPPSAISTIAVAPVGLAHGLGPWSVSEGDSAKCAVTAADPGDLMGRLAVDLAVGFEDGSLCVVMGV